MKSQKQLFWDAHRRIADRDIAFMDLISDPHNPMTNQDLKALIEKRPEVYSRYSNFLGKLKEETA